MEFLKLVLSFAPWLAFLLIGHGSLERLILGLAVALALGVIMGVMRIHRGFILWVGLTFFSLALVLVAVFHNLWTIRHMGVLANAALALGAWVGVAREKPFTLDYARDHAPEALWSSPAFIRGNMIITSVWASAFSANAVLAWMKMEHLLAPDLAWEIASYAILLATAVFTQVYPAHAKRRSAAPT
jgi:hypothetical protein